MERQVARGEVRRSNEGRLADDGVAVGIWKVYTRNGERLVVATDDDESWLDALVLESITWQTAETLDGIADETDLEGAAPPAGGDLPVTDGEAFTITNEYTRVRVTPTADATHLHLESLKLGYENELTPRQLAALANQPADRFSEFLEFPYGPDGHGH